MTPPAAVGRGRRRAGRGRRQLARDVRRPAARRARRGGARRTTPTCASPRRASSRPRRYVSCAGVAALAAGQPRRARRRQDERRLARVCRASASSRAGSSTSGAACAPRRAASELPVRIARSTPSTRGSRSPRWSPRAGSSRSRRGCRRRRRAAMLTRVRAARLASRATACASASATNTTSRWRRRTSKPSATRSRSLDLAYQQRAARARDAGRALSGGGGRRSPAQLPRWPGDGSGRAALRAARAPARRRRRRAPRRRGVLPHRGGQGRAAAAHLARRELHVASRATCSCCKSATTRCSSIGAGLLQPIFLGGALQAQVEVAHRRAEGGDRRVRQRRRSARSAKSRARCRRGSPPGARGRSCARAVRENERALELANVRYRVGSGDLRAVQQQQLALYSAQVALLRVQSERLVQRVNLHLALGGSFEIPSDGRPRPPSCHRSELVRVHRTVQRKNDDNHQRPVELRARRRVGHSRRCNTRWVPRIGRLLRLTLTCWCPTPEQRSAISSATRTRGGYRTTSAGPRRSSLRRRS